MTDIKLWAADDFYEDGVTATKVDVSTALAAKGHRPDAANCSAQEENSLLNQLCLRAHAAPDVQIFETGGTWTKPEHAASVYIVLQNAGQPGGYGSPAYGSASGGGGGGGGAGGSHRELYLPAAVVPSTLTVVVPSIAAVQASVTGDGFDAACWASYSTTTGATGSTGGTGGVCTGHSPALFADWSVEGAQGGDGGAGGGAVAGTAGAIGPTGTGGNGGALGATAEAGGHGGAPGAGYGAGGGGGGGAGSDFDTTKGGGGGGGGGGWGIGVSGAAGGSGTGGGGAGGVGGAGAPGIVVITTWFASEN